MSAGRNIQCQSTKLRAYLAVLFVWTALIAPCFAQSQKAAETDGKTPAQDSIIACRFSALDVYVDVEVKDRSGKVVPGLSHRDFLVFEDGTQQEIYSFERISEQSNTKYRLFYLPTNMKFDGKRRTVRIEARTSDGRKLQARSRLRPDPIDKINFKVSVYPQGYSIQELTRKN
jgi:hypothetical protein